MKDLGKAQKSCTERVWDWIMGIFQGSCIALIFDLINRDVGLGLASTKPDEIFYGAVKKVYEIVNPFWQLVGWVDDFFFWGTLGLLILGVVFNSIPKTPKANY